MISSQEAKDFFLLKETNTQQELAVIRRFIFDRKGTDIGVINLNPHPFHIDLEIHLLTIALDYAKSHYWPKL